MENGSTCLVRHVGLWMLQAMAAVYGRSNLSAAPDSRRRRRAGTNLDGGGKYAQMAIGGYHTGLPRMDGTVVACGLQDQ